MKIMPTFRRRNCRRRHEYLVTGLGRLQTLEDIESLVIAVREGAAVKLGDVAEARMGESYARGAGSANGKPAVLLFIQRQPQANTLELDRLLEEVFAQEAARLPRGMTLDTRLMRQADFIRTAVNSGQGHP